MSKHTPTGRRDIRAFSPVHYEVRVGADWSPVRAATVWPIADVLEAGGAFEAALATPATAFAGSVLDLVDAGMIAPPRTRRRRDRPVSSRAVFYQAADA